MRKKTLFNVLIGQLSILSISVISAFFPGLYMFFFIILFLVIGFVTFRRMRIGSKPPPAKELGPALFRENDVLKIMMLDKRIMEEFSKQMRFSFIQLVMIFPLIFILPLIRSAINILLTRLAQTLPALGEERTFLFLTSFLTFEVVFVVMNGVRFILERRYKPFVGLMPQNYVVYRNGVVLNEQMFIRLGEDYCYEENVERKFVQLKNKLGKGVPVRLYTSSINDLKKVLHELNVEECGIEEKPLG